MEWEKKDGGAAAQRGCECGESNLSGSGASLGMTKGLRYGRNFWTALYLLVLTAIFGFSVVLFAAQVKGETPPIAAQQAAVNQEASGPVADQEQNAVAPAPQKAEVPARESQQGPAAPVKPPQTGQTSEGAQKQPTADELMKPFGAENDFVHRMAKERGEDPTFLDQRYARALALIHNHDLYREKETRAFLMTPREKFCRKWNLARAYDSAFLDIGYGVTISGPHLVGRMTSALDVQPGDKVLEIGTGSGYQSAILSNLTDQVYTIEIIEKLAATTDKLYTELTAAGYPEYGKIKRKCDDGYYGWEEYAPFNKIIVTCGIDHIPPPLLKQLKVGGIMVIPVGPPGAQVVLKVTKTQDADGNFVISREDIYQGRKKVPFVPFTKKGGGTHFK